MLMQMRNVVRTGALVLLVVATTGCCVMSPVLSVCGPGGGFGGRGGGHGGGRHHLLGAAPQPVSDVPAVAAVETVALSLMYVAADADAVAVPAER